MMQNDFGWESLIHSDAPDGCSLKAALFTTYDRPGERFLVEHLLPGLLTLNHGPVSEGREQKYFLLELDERLKSSRLHGKIVIVSSAAREVGDDAAGDEEDSRGLYDWIWRSIRHLTVGSTGAAVQHAKLWLLHWEKTDGNADEKGRSEFLEIVVSSANLTRAAFKGQIQAAWKALVKMEPRTSQERREAQERRESWGVLPAFLRELAKSAGNENQLDMFVELLARARCPIEPKPPFVASVPGTHSLKKTPWGIAGLKGIVPSSRGQVSVSVLSPFVGSWCDASLQQWCGSFEGTPNKLNVLWISNAWAEKWKWLLPHSALQTFKKLGSTLLQLFDETDDSKELKSPFHDEHQLAYDSRWSHAKLYFFSRGNSRRMVVTSANFSPAAWGHQNGNCDLHIDNFELGVCINQATWPFDELQEFDDWDIIATTPDSATRIVPALAWAQAVWDGKRVVIDCRCESKEHLEATIRGVSIRETTFDTTADPNRFHANVPWDDPKDIPTWVELTCDAVRLRVPVFDARPFPDRADSAPPELDPGEIEEMRDALLFEQYGGKLAGNEDDGGRNAEGTPPEPSDISRGMTDSYDVPAFVAARCNFDIVDNWVSQFESAVSASDRQSLCEDGQRLIEAFNRKQLREHGSDTVISAKLAAEELSIRLDMQKLEG